MFWCLWTWTCLFCSYCFTETHSKVIKFTCTVHKETNLHLMRWRPLALFFCGKSCIRNLERTQRMDSWVIPDSYATESNFFVSSSWYKHISLSLVVKVVKVEVSSLPSLFAHLSNPFSETLVNLEILYCLINQGFPLITHHIYRIFMLPQNNTPNMSILR